MNYPMTQKKKMCSDKLYNGTFKHILPIMRRTVLFPIEIHSSRMTFVVAVVTSNAAGRKDGEKKHLNV